MSLTTTESFTTTDTSSITSQPFSSEEGILIALNQFTTVSIGCNAVCFVTGMSILMVRKHAFQMLLIMAPVVPGLIAIQAMAVASESLGLFRSTLISLLVGTILVVMMWIIFYFVPCMGPSCFLALLLMSSVLVLEVASEMHLGIVAVIIPVFVSVLLVLVVYSFGKIPIVRTKDFNYTGSPVVGALHTFISALAAGYGLTTSLMYFIDPSHVNLMSLSHLQLTPPTAQRAEFSNKASVGLIAWFISSVFVGITRARWFIFGVRWLWSKIRRPKTPQCDTLGLIENASVYRPSVTEFGLPADETDTVKSFAKASTVSLTSTKA